MGWGHGLGGGGLVVLAVIWVTVVVTGSALLALALSGRSRRVTHVRRRPSPREVLDLQLARGDIDVETYRDLRLDLAAAGGDRAGHRSSTR